MHRYTTLLLLLLFPFRRWTNRAVALCVGGCLLSSVLFTGHSFGQTGRKVQPREGWTAVDSSGKRLTQREFPDRNAVWLKDATKKVGPEYPYQDRARHHMGSGLFRMEIDLKTGLVGKVTMIRSTGYNSLDEAATKALAKWRFRPNSWKEVTFPVEFVMAGAIDSSNRPGPNSIPLVPDRGGRP